MQMADSEFKNDLKKHLSKKGELNPPNSISADFWQKYIEYSKDSYVQVLLCY